MDGGGNISSFFSGGTLTRLAVCAAVAAAAVTAAVGLCEGKDWPLWEKYGPWIRENKVQAIAILAAVLYGLWLALEQRQPGGDGEDGFSRCEL